MGQKLYKFKAATLDEAYRRMRTELGSDAVVLNTSDVTEGGVFGFLGHKMVEVTAAAPATPGEVRPPRSRSAVERKYAASTPVGSDERVSETLSYFRKLVRDAQERIAKSSDSAAKPAEPARGTVVPFKRREQRASHEGPSQKAHPVDELRHGVQEMRDMLEVLLVENTGTGPYAEFAEHYRRLVEQGVSRRPAAALVADVIKGSDVQAIRDARVFCERLKFQIRKAVTVTGGITLTPGIRRTVALVGATGVGKTTNLAKLAAEYAVRERVDVALITSDTYRIAAPEQLRVYANIIGLPMEVVDDPQEMRNAVEAFRNYDLILIDTAGGSQFNDAQIQELQETLAVARPDEVFLLLSANTQLHEMHNMVESFKCLGPTALFFTKLDETRQYGAMFSAYIEAGLPMAYFSVGQDVPDDIELANSGKVANLVIEGGENRDRSSSKSA